MSAVTNKKSKKAQGIAPCAVTTACIMRELLFVY